MLYFETYSTQSLIWFNQIQTTVAFMPAELARRVMRSADPEERARRAGGYILLEKMVKKHAEDFKTTIEGIVKPEFGAIFDSRSALQSVHYDAYGKPFFEGHDHVTFNLSHSHHMASCALHIVPPGETAGEVGIDTQMIVVDRIRADRVAERYFSDGEKLALARFAADDPAFCREFTRIWTRKEALLKFWGIGLGKIGSADTSVPSAHHCVFYEKEDEITFTDLNGKTHEESYITTVCADDHSILGEKPEK